MINRGNQKSLDEHMDLVVDTMNKEEKNSHIVPVNDYFCRFSPNCQHIPQGLNQRKGKLRLITDGSTKQLADDIILNEMCPIDGEPKITFGFTKGGVLEYLWNVRISYPETRILMAVADVKACFRFPRFLPDLAGVFDFMIKSLGHYYLSPAGVLAGKPCVSDGSHLPELFKK